MDKCTSGISVALLTALALVSWSWKFRWGNVNDDDDDDEELFKKNHTEERSTTAYSRKPFPWEPLDSSQQQRGRADPSTRHAPTTPTSCRGEQQKELDFLASMSFANGGIRTPNCLCCQ